MDEGEGSSVLSIYDRLLRLKEITKDHIKKMNEELDKKRERRVAVMKLRSITLEDLGVSDFGSLQAEILTLTTG